MANAKWSEPKRWVLELIRSVIVLALGTGVTVIVVNQIQRRNAITDEDRRREVALLREAAMDVVGAAEDYAAGVRAAVGPLCSCTSRVDPPPVRPPVEWCRDHVAEGRVVDDELEPRLASAGRMLALLIQEFGDESAASDVQTRIDYLGTLVSRMSSRFLPYPCALLMEVDDSDALANVFPGELEALRRASTELAEVVLRAVPPSE